MILLVSMGSLGLTDTEAANTFNAVVVADEICLRAGDGEQFDEVMSVEAAQGYRLKLLGQRGSWVQVRTASGHTGWIDRNDVERFDLL